MSDVMMDGTDADGEWSDEEVLRSGSQTGVSENDQDDGQQKYTPKLKRPANPYSTTISGSTRITTPIITIGNVMTNGGCPDPVGLILDKIDAELDAMDKKETKLSTKLARQDKCQSKSPKSGSSRHRASPFGKQEAILNGSADTGLGSASFKDSDVSDVDKGQKITGSAEMYSEAAMTDDDRTRKFDTDIPSDLDSVKAQQIDKKFKEIMLKKKVPPDLPAHPGKPLGSLTTRLRARNASRPSATMLSTGYGTDNDSVKTEEFESKFMGMLVGSTSDNERGETSLKSTEVKQVVTPSPRSQSAPPIQQSKPLPNNETPGLSPQDEELLQRLVKIAESSSTAKKTKPQPIINRPRSLSPTRMRGEKKMVSIQDADDAATSRQIERESIRIQREMERERRARSASPSPGLSMSRGSSPSHSPPPYSKPLPRAASASRGGPSYKAKSDTSAGIQQMFANTSAQFSEAEDQLIIGHELKTLRQALFLTRKELREAESELKDARTLADDSKSELMVLEFKRGNTSKDLERLMDDLKRKKGQMTALDSELHAKVQEMKNMTSLGVTREDCIEAKTVKEENLCLKTKLRNMEGLQLERDELVRQLETAKEDLFREQKQARLQRAELQEELENLTARLEETQDGWGSGQVQLAKLEAAYRRMEREKNEMIQGKAQEYEALKLSYKEETSESQRRLKNEMCDLDHEVQELRGRVTELQSDCGTKETLVEQLRAQISELQAVLAKERQDRHKTSTEQKKALQQLKKETAAAVMKLKESMFLEKQKALDNMKVELEQERRESGARSDDRLTQVLEDHSMQISDKNAEIVRLQEALRRLEKEKQIELEQQVREAVSRERERVEQDKDWQLRQEKEDSKRRTNELIVQVDREKQTNRELHMELTNLRKELEEQRRQQREASKEKLVAVARAKDQMKEQTSAEIERVKFNLKQEHEREVERLQEKLRYHEDELTSLRNEKEEIVQRERNALTALEHAERTVINEINEECHKVSGILGISPRTVHQTSFRLEHADGKASPSFRNRPVINAALANLRACNEELHNHIAELQQEVESLKMMVNTVTKEKEEAIENCRLEMEKQRTLDLEKLKDKLLKEHVAEMSNVIRECAETNSQLKTNSQYLQRFGDAALLEALQSKDDELHTMQRSMGQWKMEIEEKFNTQLQLQMAKEREKYQALQHHSTREQKRINDLQKREIDRLEKEVQRLAMSQSNSPDSNRFATSSPAPRPASAAAVTAPAQSSSSSSPLPSKSSQQYLQARIQQLQADNAALRKQRLLTSGHLNWSTPNLAKPKPIRPSSPLGRARSPTRNQEVMLRLGERIRQGEQDAMEAEERAKLNQKIMNNKMEEMTKLQNTLISQNQELQELERAYNDLHKHYTARPGSPTRNLNTTI